jgi:hypothetical protein
MKLSGQKYSPRRPPPALLRGAAGGALRWRCLAAGIGVLLLLASGVRLTMLRAQDDDQTVENREYRIKAAYLYQFGRYIEWPANAFADAQAPFVIGVMEGDPIIADLEQIAQVKKIQDRPIRIQRFASPADMRACHILFLSASPAAETQEAIVHRIAGPGVLLVGDAEKFLDWGGAIRFVVEENKVRISISRKAAHCQGLTVSAKLLQVAHVVD